MKLFNFLKKKNQEPVSPEKILQRLLEYMPDEYSQQRQFINCKEYLAQNELGLALDSLIEMTSETEHYFSEEFWNELKKAGKEMKMDNAVNYSNKQIERNAAELHSILPFGWTTIKVDEHHFQSFISSKLKNEWADERRRKDKVDDLLAKNGVHQKSHGRTGYIYFVKNGRLAELEYELGTEGLIVWMESVHGWSIPFQKDFDKDEKEELISSIKEWSVKAKISVEFE